MSRSLFAISLLAFVSPAWAQIDPLNIARLVQDGREVGFVHVGLPPGPCRSVETYYLYDTWRYAGNDASGFTVEPYRATDESAETFVRTMSAEHPGGTVVTVDIEEVSSDCR